MEVSYGQVMVLRRSCQLLKDLTPGPGFSFFSEFLSLGDCALFPFEDDEHGLELWRTDGTITGTYVLEINVNPGFFNEEGSLPEELTRVGNEAFFCAYTGDYGHELWKSDGTIAGTPTGERYLSGRCKLFEWIFDAKTAI